jgi:hypothetical protein
MHTGGILAAAAPRTPVAPGRATLASALARAVATVLGLLLALPCLTAMAQWRVTANPAAPALIAGTASSLQVAVLPARDHTGGEVSTDRPDPTATAVDALAAPPVAGGAARWHAQHAPAPHTARPHHGTAGAPRAPPRTPPHS